MLARIDRWLIRINRDVLSALLAALASMVFANVVLRYVSGSSILWVEEASRYVMIWLTFLGCGLVLRYGAHVGIDTLQDYLPRHAPRLRLAIVVLLLGFFATMVWLGLDYSVRTWSQTTPVMQIPVGAVYLAIPIGFALAIVHQLLMAVPYIRHKACLPRGEPLTP